MKEEVSVEVPPAVLAQEACMKSTMQFIPTLGCTKEGT